MSEQLLGALRFANHKHCHPSYLEGLCIEAADRIEELSSDVRQLEQSNKALMDERATMIRTHREQLDRLVKERDALRQATERMK